MLSISSIASYAQQILPKKSHSISLSNDVVSSIPTTGTLNIVAVMIEFQPDDNDLTSGTGIFEGGLPYLENDPTNIDPLPHNQSYFEAHLDFANNYFQRSSDGQLDLNYQMIPTVYRLDKEMKEYSPTGKTFTNEKLAEFIVDSWTKVEESNGFDDINLTGLDPDNTAFIIFHAGIGRDIELVGTSLDITPQDIPSITLKKNDLLSLLDQPSFDGIPVANGTFRVTNSLIIPRTESRRGLDVQENEFVFPLSINGLLCASIGSHLGLPDLFNTETGESGIGRFGLMDGASFFSYQGLFPPEPSAWEKVYLGWVSPFQVTEETIGDVALSAASSNDLNNIARYNLSSSEYFLLENRHRDLNNDGVTLTIRKNDGTEVQQTFENDNDTFLYQESDFDDLFEQGVLVDVSDFDWSLPGGLDIGADNTQGTSDDRVLNGGILIWHIDESVIAKKIAQNVGVNSDPDHRGIDLEEAEGSQNIGLPLSGALDNSAAFGIPFDFWWSGNNFTVLTQGNEIQLYKNEFSPQTFPNTNSNSGAKTFVRFYDFSDNLPTASFKIEKFTTLDFGFDQVLNLTQNTADFFTEPNSYHDFYPLSIGLHTSGVDSFVVIPKTENISAIRINVPSNPTYVISNPTNQQPLLGQHFITASNPVTAPNFLVTAYEWNSGSEDFDQIWQVDTTANNAFVSSQDGDSLFLDFTDIALDINTGANLPKQSTVPFQSEFVNNESASINGQTVSFNNSSISNYLSLSNNRLYSGVIKGESENAYYIFEDEAFILADPAKSDPFTILFREDGAQWPAISEDFEFFRVDRIHNTVNGYNRNGAILNNTPINAPEGFSFIGTPLLADITGDNDQDIIVVGQDEFSLNIFAFEKNGTLIEGFPLFVGEIVDQQVQPIHPAFVGNTLYAVSHVGDIKAWKFRNFTTSQWPTRYGKNRFNKVSADINPSTSNNGNQSFTTLNKDETYNWPNPADEETNLRFQVKDAGQVEINIITQSGQLIFKNSYTVNGGAPEEVILNTSNWASGAYFAMVKATVDGKSESKLVKIAVIH
ncbi:MAG: T9SS type A sorting domain-containing protein [Balneola sp.]